MKNALRDPFTATMDFSRIVKSTVHSIDSTPSPPMSVSDFTPPISRLNYRYIRYDITCIIPPVHLVEL